MREAPFNPMQPMQLAKAPRCGAKTRAGSPCQAPAMPNGRCRMHGGPNPGAPKGNRNAWKHGLRSGEYRLQRLMLRDMRELLAGL